LSEYQTVKIPQGLFDEVKREIDLTKELGYRNPSEFIIEAVRRRLEELKKYREE
jgi:metal-responsive CopG/Arc/MetJ family transcriptional regulator